jgi:hypothetical protein
MAGFDNNRVATGVHDDLYVRCLALGAGHQTLALCEADVIGLFYDDVLKVRPKAEWDNQAPWLQNKKDRWYGEVNSAGEEVAGAVTRALVRLREQP